MNAMTPGSDFEPSKLRTFEPFLLIKESCFKQKKSKEPLYIKLFLIEVNKQTIYKKRTMFFTFHFIGLDK